MQSVYSLVCNYVYKYPGGIAWRLKKHAKVLERHLNPNEEIEFIFTGQKTNNGFDIFCTCIVAITNKRILISQNRLLPGYDIISITPDMYNDLTARQGLIWGTIILDTVKELVYISKLSKKALPVIETAITEYMIKAKQKYAVRDNDEDKSE